MPWFFHRKEKRTLVGDAPPAYQQVGGRRYLASVPYVLPKDEREISRLDFQHYLLRVTLRGNVAAPLSAPPLGILDVGCGTGRWPIELAQQYPDASVIGVDVVLPPAGGGPERLPENCTFVVGDILAGLPFADTSFQLVHQRLLMGAIPGQRWPAAVAELARVTIPGGWVELVEAAPATRAGAAVNQLNAWMEHAMSRRGVDVHICARLGSLLRDAGLHGVRTIALDLPMGRPAGRLGVMAAANYIALFTGLRAPVVASGVPAETFDATLAAAQTEMEQVVCNSPYTVAYGQRLM